jgi:hypothetical protein
VILSLLNVDDEEVLKAAYRTLTIVAINVPDQKVPFDRVTHHLGLRPLQSAVLDLLLVTPFVGQSRVFHGVNDPVFYRQLIRLATEHETAVLVLMRIAGSHVKLAGSFIEKAVWMDKNLPTIDHTLRLFLVIFRTEDLRHQIAVDPDFPVFLNNLIEAGQEYCSITTRILKGLPDLPKKLITGLERSQFLIHFFRVEGRLKTPEAKMGALEMLSVVGKCYYGQDLLDVCRKLLTKWLFEDSTVYEAAAATATELIVNPKCEALFEQLKYVEYFRNKRKDPATKLAAAKFLKAMRADFTELA